MQIGETKNISIEELFDMIKNNDGEFEIETPHGFINIGDIYKKKNKSCYKIITKNGLILECSNDHLLHTDNIENSIFMDDDYWIYTEDIMVGNIIYTKYGVDYILSKEFIGIYDTYDLEVLHESHKYYSNNIISHNSGKTAIAEMIAQKIANKDVPHILQDKIIFSLDIGSIVAGTQYRGQMEERLKSITDYCAKNPQIILFIDEIHIIMESNSNNTMSIANIFKPYLTNGTIQCIGATTHDEHKKYFEKDGAMSRRFQKLSVEDPSPETTVKILQNCKGSYEEYHSVIYPDDVLADIPFLAKRFLPERHLPDSAIDLLDEVGAKATIETMNVPDKINKLEEELVQLNEQKKLLIIEERWQDIIPLKKSIRKIQNSLGKEMSKWETKREENKRVINKEDVLKVISLQSKIPLDEMTLNGGDKIKSLTKKFNESIIGQDEAKDKIIRSLRRSVLGINSPNKPVASFLFLGMTGTGKCFTGDGKITVKNKKTGETIELTVEEFKKLS